MDSRFTIGGLPFGAHQIAGLPGQEASALLFALLIAVRRFKAAPAVQGLVVQERAALQEAGGLYGAGLMALGLDPARLALVVAQDGAEALRIVDEAVRSGAASVVVAELPRAARRIDLGATQRFNLHGRQTSTLALLVTPDLESTSAAMTRWRAAAAPSVAHRRYLSSPTLQLELVRNRLGPVGQFTVQWSSEDEAFHVPTPLRPPVVRPPLDRSAADPGVRGLASGAGGDPQRRLAAYGGR